MNNQNQNLITLSPDGKMTVSSRQIAKDFGKRHDNILRDIKNLIGNISHSSKLRGEILIDSGNSILSSEIFIEYTYENRGKQYKEYLCTRDGFSLLVMGFTGSEALEWKLKYIDAFNLMEEELRKRMTSQVPTGKLLLAQALIEANRIIEEHQPLVDYAIQVSDSSDLISIGTLSKLLEHEGIYIGRNKLMKWLRDAKYFMKKNVPYQRYIDAGYFQLKQNVVSTPYGTKLVTQPFVTGKGQIYISEKLRKLYKEAKESGALNKRNRG